MPFIAIKGTFHVVGYSPDGDSVRFKADNEEEWEGLGGYKVRKNAKGHAQLRIEAIDTLETHYKSRHQPKVFAKKATEKLFKLLGIKNVLWNSSGSRVASADDGVPGFIVSRTVERYGRPVSFVFPGSVDLEDGGEIYLGKTLARKSVNFKMLKAGLAYPTFYDGLFFDLREAFAAETRVARKAKKGIWKGDKTTKGIVLQGFDDIENDIVMMPKIFRRIAAFLKDNNESWEPNLFILDLSLKPEKVFYMKNLHFTHFDDMMTVTPRGKLKLISKPEDLIFIS